MNENKDDDLFKYYKFNKFCFILKYQPVRSDKFAKNAFYF